MKHIRVTSAVVIAGIAALAIAVSSGTARTTRPLPAAGTALTLRQTPFGNALVAANGRTLYRFEADKPDVSTLSRAGFAVWPAFTSARRPLATGGVNAAHIGTVTRPNGSPQVTYYGHPLYFYVGDRKPGETNGQGLKEFGALWYVLSGRGKAVTSAPITPSSSTQSGYGY